MQRLGAETDVIIVRLDKETKAKFKQACKKSDSEMSQIVRKLIDSYLKKVTL